MFLYFFFFNLFILLFLDFAYNNFNYYLVHLPFVKAPNTSTKSSIKLLFFFFSKILVSIYITLANRLYTAYGAFYSGFYKMYFRAFKIFKPTYEYASYLLKIFLNNFYVFFNPAVIYNKSLLLFSLFILELNCNTEAFSFDLTWVYYTNLEQLPFDYTNNLYFVDNHLVSLSLQSCVIFLVIFSYLYQKNFFSLVP